MDDKELNSNDLNVNQNVGVDPNNIEQLDPIPNEENIIASDVVANNKENKPKKNNSSIIIGIIVLLLIVAGLVYYFLFMNKNMTAKEFYETAIDKVNTNINESLKSNLKTAAGSMAIDIDAGDKTDETTALLSDIDLAFDYAIDMNQNIVTMDLQSTYQKEKLVNASFYLMNNKAYVDLQDLYAKKLYLDTDSLDLSFNNLDNDSIKTVANSVFKALKNSLKEEYYKTDKVDGYTIYKIEINTNQLEEFFTSLKNSLKADEDFIEAYTKLTDKTKQEVILEIENSNFNDINGKINIESKVKNNKTSEISITVSDNEETFTFKMTDITESAFNYVISNEKDSYKGNIEFKDANDKTTYKIVVEENKTNGIKLSISGSTDKNATVSKPNVTNAVNFNTLTQEDQTSIMLKLMENKGAVKLMQLFNGSY